MIKVIRTSKQEKEIWAKKPDLALSTEYNADVLTVAVNSRYEFQTHLGFGGAFTEATAFTLNEGGEEIKREAVKAYFSADGLNYNLGRMPVHSCDFSLNSYTYIQENDESLKTFDMSHEDKWVVPLIKQAQALRKGDLTMFASSWSPPAFMKTTGEMKFGGKLKPQFRDSYAEYLVKFIEGLKERGIEIFAISMQNEPEAKQTWESCLVTAEEEGVFIADYLAPKLREHSLNTKIVVWDHNRDRVVQRVNTTFKNKKAKEAVWGVGYHWYVSEDSRPLTTLHTLFEDKHLLMTECCVELTNTALNSNGTQKYAGDYSHGEKYGKNIINDFNNFSEGWIDWNLVLNEQGGPNHVSNFCEAPIMYDRTAKKLIYNNSYYYIGHFSRYINVGARRLLCSNDNNEDVFSVSYKNVDGNIVTVVMNEGKSRACALVIDGEGANVELLGNSITTFIKSK